MAVAKRSRTGSKKSTAGRKMIVVSPADMVVPGYTRNNGNYGRYNRCCRPSELKYLDTAHSMSIDPTDLSRNEVFQELCKVPIGTGPNDRIGQSITIKSVGINYSVWMPAQTGIPIIAVQSHQVRLILVQDKQTNSTGMSAEDLLQDAGSPTDPSAQAFRRLTNSGRFNVLADVRHNLNYDGVAYHGGNVATPPATNGLVGTAQTLTSGTIWKDCNIKIEYGAGGTGAITEIKSNNLSWVMLLETLPIAGTGGVSLIMQARVRYEDQ